MTEALLEGLDQEQRDAVVIDHHPLVIEAGAGSGKTRVLTRRIAHRVAEGQIRPEHVLAVTFTRKAAGELRERLAHLGVRGVAAGTFHSLAWAHIRRYWETRDIAGPRELIDRKARLLAPLLSRRGGRASRVEPRDIAAEIEWAKVRLVTPERYAEAAAHRRAPLSPEEVAELYAAYEEAKRGRDALDFEDMLSALAGLARSDPELAAELRARHRHVFVDEFQDTSPLGHSVLCAWLGVPDRKGRTLAPGTDLCVVGDPDQAIFSFSGADSRYLTDFESHWLGATRLRLTANYRSRPHILGVANALLADGALGAGQDPPKRLRATRPESEPPEVMAYPDERAEATAVARLLRRHAFAGQGWRSAAVLYRTNAQSAALEAALSAAGIPYRVRGDRAFASRPEVRRVLAAASRSKGERALATLEALVAREKEAGGLDDDAQANLDVLVGLAEEHAEGGGHPTTAAFLEWLSRTASGDESRSSAAVELVTLHRAKGLEWDVVVVTGCEAGLLPVAMARTTWEAAEERRLLYVGITRARETLLLTRAEQRHGVRGSRGPSPFLEPVTAALDAMRRGASPSTDWYQHLGRQRAEATAEKARPPDAGILGGLRAWRSETARADGVPAYIVFSDATLEEVARRRPRTPSALLAVDGVGPVKLARYGAALLELAGGAEGAAPWTAPEPVPVVSTRPETGADPQLVTALRAWRGETARSRGVPAYVVLHDRTLEAIAAHRPRTPSELLAIEGIGPTKLERYGPDVLAVVATTGPA